ncbi:hypothetical protein Bhyg_05688, partial [Pseudolycoriella hygida]
RQQIDPNVSVWLQEHFRSLEIFNSSIEEINEKFFEFHGFQFETILIENAPELKSIHPKALFQLKDTLTDFRAIETNLPSYNDYGNGAYKNDNPFDDFKNLREVYIGEQSRCPIDETLLFPCTCEFGELSRGIPSGLDSWSFGTSNTFGTTTQLTCQSTDMTGNDLKKVFESISRSEHSPKHFDVLTIRKTPSLTHIPSDVFSNVTITTIWMDEVENLKSIHPQAFYNDASDATARSIQVLDVTIANFTTATPDEVQSLFRAFSSLINIRVLRLTKCGIPYIPPNAFTPEDPQKQLNNLRYLSMAYDRRHHNTGIKSVGSYAFSGAPKLIELGLRRNFIEEFHSFAFGFNKTSNKRLTIYIGGNPFNDSYGLMPDAFSGARRPVKIIFDIDSFAASDRANDPSLDFMPENVFRPFVEENSENVFEVDYFNVDVWCDCRSKWMFDDNGRIKNSVQNALKIKRVEDNVVSNDAQSIQCKANSSFECLPICLSFPLAGLIHCGGDEEFDVKSTFLRVGESIQIEEFKKLQFSSKRIQKLPMNAFGNFQFEEIIFEDCINLSSIHPTAFGASTSTVKRFTADNTSLTYYPNFASFPKLQIIRLDDHHTFDLNSTNFEYTETTSNPEEIVVFLNNGTVDANTFTKLKNDTAMTLIIECSCDLKWMNEGWAEEETRIGIWFQEYFGKKFYCVPKDANLQIENNFFGIDVSQFNYG